MGEEVFLIKSVFVFLAAMGFSAYAQAKGGVIGGGDVQLKPIFSCQANSMDITHPSLITRVTVVAEADYDGNITQNMPLVIMLSDGQDKALDYLQTNQLPKSFNPSRILIYEWKETVPGQSNRLLGAMEVNAAHGNLKAYTLPPRFDSLQLSNCYQVVQPL